MTSKIDAILAKQKELAAELESAMKEERAAVLADIKAKIKMFDFNSTDFKGMFKTRTTQKQVDEFLAMKKKAEAKKVAKEKPKAS